MHVSNLFHHQTTITLEFAMELT